MTTAQPFVLKTLNFGAHLLPLKKPLPFSQGHPLYSTLRHLYEVHKLTPSNLKSSLISYHLQLSLPIDVFSSSSEIKHLYALTTRKVISTKLKVKFF